MSNKVKLTLLDKDGKGTDTSVSVTAKELALNIANAKANPVSLWVPPSVRYVERGYTGDFREIYLVVVETPPKVHRLNVDYNVSRNDYKQQFKLSLPYLVQIVPITVTSEGRCVSVLSESCATFYRVNPLTGFSDELLSCNLPNISYHAHGFSGWTCLGMLGDRETRSIHRGEDSMSAAIDLAVNVTQQFFQSQFNGDVIDAWLATQGIVPECDTFDTWEEESAIFPEFVLSANWLPHPEGMTLGDFLEYYRRWHRMEEAKPTVGGEHTDIYGEEEYLSNALLPVVEKKRPGARCF